MPVLDRPVDVDGFWKDGYTIVRGVYSPEEIAETRRKKASKTLIPQDSRVSLEALTSRLSEADQLELKLIIKGDVQGSVEAIAQALAKLGTEEVVDQVGEANGDRKQSVITHRPLRSDSRLQPT